MGEIPESPDKNVDENTARDGIRAKTYRFITESMAGRTAGLRIKKINLSNKDMVGADIRLIGKPMAGTAIQALNRGAFGFWGPAPLGAFSGRWDSRSCL